MQNIQYKLYDRTEVVVYSGKWRSSRYNRVKKGDIMRKILLPLVLVVGLLAFAVPASALFIVTGEPDAGTNVGSIDTFKFQGTQDDVDLAYGSPGNSPEAETAWVRVVLGDPSVVFEVKHDPEPAVQLTDDVSGKVYAFQLDTKPEYFMVKTGKNDDTDPDYRYFLFQNVSSLDWGVIYLADLGADYYIKDIDAISHVDEFNAAVPEPSTMLLLGSGLLGLYLSVRKKN